MARYRREQIEWAMERIESCGDINHMLDIFEAEWGERPTKQSVYQWAWKRGKHVGAKLDRPSDKASRVIWWPKEPELMAWMLENANGKPVSVVQAEFRKRFGFDISKPQVNVWRQHYGTVKKAHHRNEFRLKPIGTERHTKCGTMVKVRELPNRPGSHDNWEYLHHIVYRENFGEIPEGCQVVFADRDHSNVSPDNLVAVPKKLIGILNGIGWSDMDTLRLAIAEAELKRATMDAQMREATCQVCGKRFKPWARSNKRASTCRECLDAGHLSKGTARTFIDATCAVCGARFTANRKSTRRCHECVAAKPKWSTGRHATHYARTGER